MGTLIHGAKQIVCVSNSLQNVKIGKDMNNIILLEEVTEGLSIVVNEHGKIEAIGKDSQIELDYKDCAWKNKIDAEGKCILPGLVDAHTHPVWAGDRVHEFAMKLEGATYLDIHKAGGGIHFTVQKTKEASKEELMTSLLQRLKLMASLGTTLVECKSGYGLDFENELKMLQVIENSRNEAPLSISITYCGAHAVPKGSTAVQATKDISQIHIPQLRKLVDAGELQVDSVDVFCEKGVFGVEESKKILSSARNHGFMLNFHAEELNHIGGAMMGASLNAEAMSHLEEINEDDINAMKKSQSVAVLLPTTAHLLKLTPPPARKLIDAGVPVALGTDFNPNAHCLSMPIAMHFACVQMQLSMKEALVASTLNAAYALRRSNEVGSIEIGKFADLIILNAPKWEHIIYQLGCEQQLIKCVMHHGKIVHENY